MIYLVIGFSTLFISVIILRFYYRYHPVKYYMHFLNALTSNGLMKTEFNYLFEEPINEEDIKNYSVGVENVVTSLNELQSSYCGMIAFDFMSAEKIKFNHMVRPNEVKIKGIAKINFGREKHIVHRNAETLTYFRRGPKGWKLVYFGLDIN